MTFKILKGSLDASRQHREGSRNVAGTISERFNCKAITPQWTFLFDQNLPRARQHHFSEALLREDDHLVLVGDLELELRTTMQCSCVKQVVAAMPHFSTSSLGGTWCMIRGQYL